MSKLQWFFNVTLRDKTNPFWGPFRRRNLRGTDFTIISNNCWGGHAYRWYDLPYNSPTVGLYFWADDYLKFVSDLRRYTKGNLEFISPYRSCHFDELKKLDQLDVPIGLIDDVEVVFLHYQTEIEASEKWKRRCKRINWEHILVKNSFMNGCTKDIMREFLALDFKSKLFFVGGCPKMKNQKDGHSKYGADSRFDTLDLASGEAEKSIFGQSGGGGAGTTPGTIVYKNFAHGLELEEDTLYFNKFFNLTDWINKSYE